MEEEGLKSPIAVYGSPFTLFAGRFGIAAVPAVWLVLGWLLASERRGLAAIWLVLHYVIAPIAVTQVWAGSWQRELEALIRVNRHWLARGLVEPYLFGQLVAWMMIARVDKRT